MPLCVFSLPRVFYHCPTSFTTIDINLLAGRPDDFKIFFSIPTTTVCHRTATSDGSPRFSTLSTLITVCHPATWCPMLATICSVSPGPLSAVVRLGKGLPWQVCTQIGDLVGIGNNDQTNQKGSSGTRKALVTVGNPGPDQTKTAKQIRSASTGYGRDW